MGWVRRYVQVEYGPMELDLNLRVRIYELEKHLKAQVSQIVCGAHTKVVIPLISLIRHIPGYEWCISNAAPQVQYSIQCSIQRIAMLCHCGQTLHPKYVAYGWCIAAALIGPVSFMRLIRHTVFRLDRPVSHTVKHAKLIYHALWPPCLSTVDSTRESMPELVYR